MNWSAIWRPRASWVAGSMRWWSSGSWKEGGSRGQSKTEDHNPGLQEGKLCPVQGPDWKNLLWQGHRPNRGPGELVDFEGSPSARSRKVHPSAQEKKQMHINAWWGRGSKEDGAIAFPVVPSDRPRVNGHKLNYSKFHLNIRKNCGGDWMLEDVAQRGWRPSISGGSQNSAEFSPQQTTLAHCALSRGLD